jgi:hypothetical protein
MVFLLFVPNWVWNFERKEGKKNLEMIKRKKE